MADRMLGTYKQLCLITLSATTIKFHVYNRLRTAGTLLEEMKEILFHNLVTAQSRILCSAVHKSIYPKEALKP